ncbi:MAG: DUF4093 domain-containing protein [Oscillospiraceae bacterium]|nr:DUF4093 domain-containing protein [Oscillospiraceae bacterium]
MLYIERAVIVEGKYDKIKLASVIDAVIITTDGFGVFKNQEKLALIRHYAAKTGIVILTDSDTAGFKIRNFLKGAVKGDIVNVYIPDIFGKEKRKDSPSKEGKLGVEGVDVKILTAAFEKAGIAVSEKPANNNPVTRTVLYELGLSGGKDSAQKRREILAALNLPQLLTTSGMLEMINTMMSADEFKVFIDERKL